MQGGHAYHWRLLGLLKPSYTAQQQQQQQEEEGKGAYADFSMPACIPPDVSCGLSDMYRHLTVSAVAAQPLLCQASAVTPQQREQHWAVCEHLLCSHNAAASMFCMFAIRGASNTFLTSNGTHQLGKLQVGQ
jgi:hypothetical protein